MLTFNVYSSFFQVSTTLSMGGFIVKLIVLLFMVETGEIDGPEQEIAAGARGNNDVDDKVPADDDSAVHLAPIWLLVVVALLNAFAVAAMVEEITKYFGFWMVEHPDLALAGTGNSSENAADTETAPLIPSDTNDVSPSPTTSEPRTFKSVGAGITVAMVTTAMGFACCENFMYVFFYAHPSNPTTEITTLLARSIFPVHPLAAAIQSIGVCRRDLEKDQSMGFGWIILPAVILHGSFDFALMLLDLLYKREESAQQADNDDSVDTSRLHSRGDVPQPGTSADSVSLQEQLPALLLSVGIVFIGAIYYVCMARAQRKRLEELDNRRQEEGSEYEQIS